MTPYYWINVELPTTPRVRKLFELEERVGSQTLRYSLIPVIQRIVSVYPWTKSEELSIYSFTRWSLLAYKSCRERDNYQRKVKTRVYVDHRVDKVVQEPV